MFAHHHFMISDTLRTEAYRRAILAQVRRGDVVIDFGTGTGVMSLFAAQAGARKVYALEKTTDAHAAREMVSRNGYADVIEVIRGDGTALELPEQADWIISEMMDTTFCDEYDMAPLGRLRERFLKPDGGMIPHRVDSFLQLFSLSSLYERWQGFYRERPYELDWSMMAEEFQHRPTKHAILKGEGDERPLTASVSLHSQDLRREPMPPFNHLTLPERKRIVNEAGTAHALVSWFEAHLGGGEILTDAPFAPRTHWNQDVHWLDRPISVKPGDELILRLDIGRTADMRYYPRSVAFVRNGTVFHEQHVSSLDLRYTDRAALARKTGRFLPTASLQHRRIAAVLPLLDEHRNALEIARLVCQIAPGLFRDEQEAMIWMVDNF